MYIKNGDRADRLASRPFSPTTLTTPRVKDKSGSKRCLFANGNSVYLIDTLSKVPTYLFFATAFRPAVQPHPASIVNK